MLTTHETKTRKHRPPEGLHAPKPLTPRTRLGKVLLALDVTFCECHLHYRREQKRKGNAGQGEDAGGNDGNADNPLAAALASHGPPCYHTETCNHCLPFAAWLRLLKSHDAEGYAEPPPPAEAMPPADWADRPCPKRGLRVDAYHARAAAGVGLYHADDNADAASLLAWARGALARGESPEGGEDAHGGPPCRGIVDVLAVAAKGVRAAVAMLAARTAAEACEPWAVEVLAEARRGGVRHA